jgi:imidazoleglycerol-phosphate dehydratase
MTAIDSPRLLQPRTASVHRRTNETDVQVHLNLDGRGQYEIDTGIPFLDHMLAQLSTHGLIDLQIKAVGDLHIDDHHTNEDVGIALGQALAQALQDRRGIYRFGHFWAPLDEALVQVVLDFSGRPHLSYGLELTVERIGRYETQLVREFYQAVAKPRPAYPAHPPGGGSQCPPHRRGQFQGLCPRPAHGRRTGSAPTRWDP